MRHRLLLTLATAGLGAPLVTSAEDEVPPGLKSLQATYQEQQAKLTKAYTDRLKALRASFEKDQKLYEGALVYEEIKRVAANLPAKASARPPGLTTFPVGNVEIISAVWGVRSSVVDITQKVVETLERGENVKVSYTNLGDPRPGSGKDLVVTYMFGDKLRVIGVGAGKSLSYEQLVESPTAASSPTAGIDGVARVGGQ